MAIDFEAEFGVNAGYVELLFERWRQDPAGVDGEWRTVFERLDPETAAAGRQKVEPRAPSATATLEPPARSPRAKEDDGAPDGPADDDDYVYERLIGVSARIAANMTASLALPTATSVRTLPMKVLDENRRILNDHMRVRALGKASYTHVVAFALVRALAEMPNLQSACVEQDGRLHRRTPKHVNLGLAIDVPGKDGGARTLLVPNIPRAEELDFGRFRAAYEDVVGRARDGALTAADFQGTTVTLTNPGGFGTELSVPRLMQGQGLIVATGSIGVRPEARHMAAGTLAELAIGPVMTVTSTYDHRVVQGAESALLLARLEELLEGADRFYESIFGAMRVPWAPWKPAVDVGSIARRGADDLEARVSQLVNAYRVRGCQLADLDPLEYKPDPLPSLDPGFYGFTLWDLDREFLTGGMGGKPKLTLREILAVLREAYCRRWTIEYMHITPRIPKFWLRDRMEEKRHADQFDHEHRVRILTRLYQAENFERFLHTRYVGNKRFSLEGADVLIPALAELLDRAGEHGVEQVVIGMAHRGRLNVLANILGKSYGRVFREFQGVVLPLSSEGSGDVKYHLGQRGTFRTAGGRDIEVVLSANPSHLEAVDPVVCGMVRGYQDELEDSARKRVLGVLIHGDAAFSGQGVVAETLNMSALRAYASGGTVHLVVNNQIGFTTGPIDLRSTYYCTDVAKSIQAPILHANGDYPESVMRAVHVAADYHEEFGKDVVIDIVCYRRWGHNEGDEPAYTQPVLYAKIREHPTVREHYVGLLLRRGDVERAEAEAIGQRFDEELRAALETVQAEPPRELELAELVDLADDDPDDWCDASSPDTGVPPERLIEIVDRTNKMPDGHVTHPNLLRQLRRRERMVRGETELDWGCAEVAAFGSLLEDDVSVRLAGQDSRRGTFSHRHSVIRDQKTDADWIPLAALAPKGTTFESWDSLLSEEAALGYEYGYALARPASLVLWEAQFGDFVNGAQIPIDQFLVSGEAKWKQTSGVVLLLPHGFDGQGPEHSSARPERFLAACSGGNLAVANCTTSAQYFHLLRRQGLAAEKRPLVVLTPKSLLRDKRAASPIEHFTEGRFHELLVDPPPSGRAPERVILCSGKVYYDLAEHRDGKSGVRDGDDGAHGAADREPDDARRPSEHDLERRANVALLRLEQLYPFPRKALQDALESLGADTKLVWCQEEPRNMGAWSFVLQRMLDQGRTIEYAGRPDSASPATGSYHRHVAEQSHLVRRAFGEA